MAEKKEFAIKTPTEEFHITALTAFSAIQRILDLDLVVETEIESIVKLSSRPIRKIE